VGATAWPAGPHAFLRRAGSLAPHPRAARAAGRGARGAVIAGGSRPAGRAVGARAPGAARLPPQAQGRHARLGGRGLVPAEDAVRGVRPGARAPQDAPLPVPCLGVPGAIDPEVRERRPGGGPDRGAAFGVLAGPVRDQSEQGGGALLDAPRAGRPRGRSGRRRPEASDRRHRRRVAWQLSLANYKAKDVARVVLECFAR
jgi:hypothetical protein